MGDPAGHSLGAPASPTRLKNPRKSKRLCPPRWRPSSRPEGPNSTISSSSVASSPSPSQRGQTPRPPCPTSFPRRSPLSPAVVLARLGVPPGTRVVRVGPAQGPGPGPATTNLVEWTHPGEEISISLNPVLQPLQPTLVKSPRTKRPPLKLANPPSPPQRSTPRNPKSLKRSRMTSLPSRKSEPEVDSLKPEVANPPPLKRRKTTRYPLPPGPASLLREGSPEVVFNPTTKRKILEEVENIYRTRSVRN